MRAAVHLNRESLKTTDRLTCSNNPLDFNAGGVQLLGKLMDSPVWILVGFRVNVGFCAWKFNCRQVIGLLWLLNIHMTVRWMLDSQMVTKISESEQSAELVSDRFSHSDIKNPEI